MSVDDPLLMAYVGGAPRGGGGCRGAFGGPG
ncbi:hypothetical protein QF025_006886 [Paraburkholderia graminis]|uniref:Uncharacterized protein n=1 Tax=Paraburkholderia graminis TaxID=60548 RepID=A0ABD5CTP4_9BURK|nr:hypothetical protein [Paraburkholderia graminis]